MPRSASTHPEQAAVLAPLLRLQAGKVWAIELGIAESEVSRWRSGQRPASLDDLAEIVAIARRYGREDLLAEARRAVLLALGLGDERPPPPPDALATVGAATRAGADTAAVVLGAIRDGRIDQGEAAEIRASAATHREIARRLDALAERGDAAVVDIPRVAR